MATSNNSGTEKRKVFVIDDHPLVRAGMARIVDIEDDLKFCGEAGKGRGSIELVEAARPDVIILDLSLGDSNGLELIKDFRNRGIKIPILVVSMHDETIYAERVIRAGANGFLMKEEATDQVVEGLREILAGEIFLSHRMQGVMLRRMAGREDSAKDGISIDKLSDRELEIFELVGKGMNSHEIATALSISHKTVDTHRTNIREKLGLPSSNSVAVSAAKWFENN